MIRFKKSKKILAAILTAGMLLAGNGVPIRAAEPVSMAQAEEQLIWSSEVRSYVHREASLFWRMSEMVRRSFRMRF